MNRNGMLVYFILDANSRAVKIGKTSGSAHDRMVALQTGNPNQLELVAIAMGYSLESELHDRLWRHRIRGEWFRLAEPVAREILRRRQSHVSYQPDLSRRAEDALRPFELMVNAERASEAFGRLFPGVAQWHEQRKAAA